MAVITTQPFVLDSTNKPSTSNENFCPLMMVSGKAYAQLNANDVATDRIQTYRSVATPTFTPQDTGLTPTNGAQCATIGGDGKIYSAGTNSGGTATQVTVFDPATDTYDFSIADMPAVDNPFCMVRLSNGDLLTYSVDTSANGKLYQRMYSAGSNTWGSRTALFTQANYERTIVRAAADASDRTHIFFAMKVDSTHRDIWYLQIASDGTVAISEALAFNLTVASSITPNTGNVAVDNANDKVYFIFSPKSPGGATDHIPRVIRGTTLSAPTFATSELDSGLVSIPATPDQNMYLFLAFAGTVLSGFWSICDTTISPPTQTIQVWMNTLSGTWGTPQLFWDGVANPPGTGIDSMDYNTPSSLTICANGSSWIGTVTLNENTGSFFDLDVFLGTVGGGRFTRSYSPGQVRAGSYKG